MITPKYCLDLCGPLDRALIRLLEIVYPISLHAHSPNRVVEISMKLPPSPLSSPQTGTTHTPYSLALPPSPDSLGLFGWPQIVAVVIAVRSISNSKCMAGCPVR